MSKKKIDLAFEKAVKLYAKRNYQTERVARQRLKAAAKGESLPTLKTTAKQSEFFTEAVERERYRQINETVKALGVKKKPAKKQAKPKPKPKFFNDRLGSWLSGNSGKITLFATLDFYGNDKRHRSVTLRQTPEEMERIAKAETVTEVLQILKESKDGQFLADANITDIEQLKIL